MTQQLGYGVAEVGAFPTVVGVQVDGVPLRLVEDTLASLGDHRENPASIRRWEGDQIEVLTQTDQQTVHPGERVRGALVNAVMERVVREGITDQSSAADALARAGSADVVPATLLVNQGVFNAWEAQSEGAVGRAAAGGGTTLVVAHRADLHGHVNVEMQNL